MSKTNETLSELTREQAAILTAYTGVTCGPFEAYHEYAQKLLGRPIWTHEFANPDFVEGIKELATPDFMAIGYKGDTVHE